MATKTKKDYVYATGKRRTASARARIYRGKGITLVNGKEVSKYFSSLVTRELVFKPFKILDISEKYYATVKVVGGGLSGQLTAVAHSIAKALAKVEKENFRPLLKQSGLLTRDSRIRQRRMVGTGGKSRRAKQSPKR